MEGQDAEFENGGADIPVKRSSAGESFVEQHSRLCVIAALDRQDAQLVGNDSQPLRLVELSEQCGGLVEVRVGLVELACELGDDPELPQRPGLVVRISCPAARLERTLRELSRACQIPLVAVDDRSAVPNERLEWRLQVGGELDRQLDPSCALAQMSREVPEHRQQGD